jgi:signal transduction histidine kinase
MIRSFHMLLISILLTGGLSAQKIKVGVKYIPSLLAVDHPSEKQMDSLRAISLNYIYSNQDTCMLVAKRVADRAERWYEGTIQQGDALLTLGDAYTVHNEWENALAALAKAKVIYEKKENKARLALTYLKSGSVHLKTDNYELALQQEFSALDTWLELKDTANIFKPYFEIGHIFFLTGQRLKAYEYNAEALRWGRVKESSGIINVALNNQSELEKVLAQEYRKKADTSATPEVYLDSMQLFLDRGVASLTEALEINQNGSRYRLFLCLNNFADLRMDRGEYDEALALAQQAEMVTDSLNSGEFKLANKYVFARLYRLRNQPKQAIKAGLAGLALPSAQKKKEVAHNIHEQLYLAYKDLGNPAAALPHYEAYSAFEIESVTAAQARAIATVEAKYQTAKKETQLIELGAANEQITRQRNYIIAGAATLTLLGLLAFQLPRVRQERNRRIEFTQALIEGQEEERKRIARDLHDGIGQSLLVIKRQLDANKNSTFENRTLISSTLEEVRSISRDLHPILLEKFGITSTLKDVVTRVGDHAPELFITTDIEDIDGLLDQKAEVQAFRAVQEALSNVVKHAGATAAKVTVEKVENGVKIIVQDNGKGFDIEMAVVKSRSLGLRTMSERMATVDGSFKIEAGESTGTVVRLHLPVKSSSL